MVNCHSELPVRTGGRLAWWAGDDLGTEAPAVLLLRIRWEATTYLPQHRSTMSPIRANVFTPPASATGLRAGMCLVCQ